MLGVGPTEAACFHKVMLETAWKLSLMFAFCPLFFASIPPFTNSGQTSPGRQAMLASPHEYILLELLDGFHAADESVDVLSPCETKAFLDRGDLVLADPSHRI